MNMKLTKLALLIALAAPLVASAQVMEKYEGFQLNRMSNNGRFLIDGVDGVKIIDRKTQEQYTYGSNYYLGIGNSISDDGIVVGTHNELSTPCYWKDGVWYDLPHNVPDVFQGMASGITSDGKYIIGLMSCGRLTGKAWPQTQPVLWSLDESTGEYVFSILPIPDKDITTCSPQQVHGRYISDDGNVVLAQIVDYRGLLQYQLVYNKDENGEWTYTVSGAEKLIKPEAEWPEYPTRPTMPKPEDYLTQEEILAFNQANRAYTDSLEIVSLTGKYPKAPFYQDFVKERKDEYDADVLNYNIESQSYITKLYAFFDAYEKNVTNDNFNTGSQRLSANGKYYAANFVFSGPEDPETNQCPTYMSPLRCDIESGEFYHTYHSSMASFSIADDGRILAVTPRAEDKVLTRVPYIIYPDRHEEYEPFEKWIAKECPAAYNWIQDNMKYNVDAADSQSGVAVRDSVFYGSIRMNPDFRKMISYVVNPANQTYESYYISLDDENYGDDSVESVSSEDNIGVYPSPTSDIVNFYGSISSAEIYTLGGELIWRRTGDEDSVSMKSLGAAPGIYLVHLGSAGGYRTERIILK